ncbi:CPBP family intramembrane glutamic endopeptidase [Aquirhabdus parva]|uniref:CPBP family intramembrane glutamic endopeptidase n=1 Tax=Aquirhabdus parva TaxID=2283318 RepID=UPI0013B412D2|nr:CPBP family intramembrane glutamic endopeptidase [Aquirhabdus parva]
MSGQWRNLRVWLLSLLAFAILSIYFTVLLHTPTWSALFLKLEWNWLGKITSITTLCLIYLALPQQIKNNVGLSQWPHPQKWRSTLLVSIFTLLFFVSCSALIPLIISHQCAKPSLETILFEATLPGIDEELLFRGILLAILTVAFGKPWKIAGITIGWGAIPLVIVFGLAHGVEVAHSGAPFLLSALVSVITGIMGALLLWIKERTGSIWVAVIVHNLANVLSHWVCG